MLAGRGPQRGVHTVLTIRRDVGAGWIDELIDWAVGWCLDARSIPICAHTTRRSEGMTTAGPKRTRSSTRSLEASSPKYVRMMDPKSMVQAIWPPLRPMAADAAAASAMAAATCIFEWRVLVCETDRGMATDVSEATGPIHSIYEQARALTLCASRPRCRAAAGSASLDAPCSRQVRHVGPQNETRRPRFLDARQAEGRRRSPARPPLLPVVCGGATAAVSQSGIDPFARFVGRSLGGVRASCSIWVRSDDDATSLDRPLCPLI